uniref:Uncharacterized protein n=1 Tax=Ciona savignyi TaxID=51511 RepID=H2YGF5_CIOSA
MWLKVQLLGWCKTKWKVGSGDDEKTYKGKEEYCSEEIYIWGGGKHGNIWYIIQVTHLLGGSFQSPQSVSVPFVVDEPLEYTVGLIQRAICYGKRSDFSWTSSGNMKQKAKVDSGCRVEEPTDTEETQENLQQRTDDHHPRCGGFPTPQLHFDRCQLWTSGELLSTRFMWRSV